ncbi:MAG: hypothetical protein SP1CHLAM54_17350 [Chlamydiia bacterium]|nr:hypothetical protein [Chlamydiia bacterium]MCH9616623.1 hypothetical protein [Chlamydiia bacterium]MCH9629353.1 hypothetical protein [Chlamydiia bacterium]
MSIYTPGGAPPELAPHPGALVAFAPPAHLDPLEPVRVKIEDLGAAALVPGVGEGPHIYKITPIAPTGAHMTVTMTARPDGTIDLHAIALNQSTHCRFTEVARAPTAGDEPIETPTQFYMQRLP